MTLEPDPAIARSISFLLGCLPADDAIASFRKAVLSMYAGARAKGWKHDAAVQFALDFADLIVSEMQEQIDARVVH